MTGTASSSITNSPFNGGASLPPSDSQRHDRKRPSSAKVQRSEDGNKKRKLKAKDKKSWSGSAEEILARDVEDLLKSQAGQTAEEKQMSSARRQPLPDLFTEIELEVQELSSTGEGLAFSTSRDHVYVVPFALPSDTVVAKVVYHHENHSMTDFVRVVTPSRHRDDDLVFCKYFSICSGCQFQMMPYDLQLEHKRGVIVKAFNNFSGLPKDKIPDIGATFASPLRKGYRTKLTPHFDGPRRGGFKPGDKTPDIGFQVKGRRFVLDIEDCPIGTDAVREGMQKSRKFVQENLQTYKRGATLLLRENTSRIPVENGLQPPEKQASKSTIRSTITNSRGTYVEEKSCITNSNEMSTEYIGETRFDSTAGSFFQNNNSILKDFTAFVRTNLDLPRPNSTEAGASRYLVDAYCGSGLFAISCGSAFDASIGVDISVASIESARANAVMNNVANTKFITGNAETIFAEITFPSDQTSVIIDPPRKGCDEVFLKQLLNLGPRRIVYISCNVHTLARDVGWILRHEKGTIYNIDSIKGFDFFPQTHHVEGIAVLTKSSGCMA